MKSQLWTLLLLNFTGFSQLLFFFLSLERLLYGGKGGGVFTPVPIPQHPPLGMELQDELMKK